MVISISDYDDKGAKITHFPEFFTKMCFDDVDATERDYHPLDTYQANRFAQFYFQCKVRTKTIIYSTIRANTKLGYIDLSKIVPTEKQYEKINEILSAVRNEIQIIDNSGEHIYNKPFDSDKLLDILKSVNGVNAEI